MLTKNQIDNKKQTKMYNFRTILQFFETSLRYIVQ